MDVGLVLGQFRDKVALGGHKPDTEAGVAPRLLDDAPKPQKPDAYVEHLYFPRKGQA